MCCDTLPQAQLGDHLVYPSNREVLAMAKEWRAANPRRPLAEAMCYPNDVSNIGGQKCRGEGEVCDGKLVLCLLYTITAPYYHANIPFVVNNQKIKKKVEKLLEEDRKLERNRTKNTQSEVTKRAAFQDHLNMTFNVMKEHIRNLINLCPVRGRAKKETDIEIVDGLSNDNPEREVVAVDREVFIAAVQQRLQQQQQEDARNEVRERRNREREALQEGLRLGQLSHDSQESQEEPGQDEEEGGEGTTSTLPSELEREDTRREKSKRLARKRKIRVEHIDAKVPYDMLRRLTPLLTSCGVTHNNATKVVAAFYRECDIDFADVVLSVSSSKRIREAENKFVKEKALEHLAKEVSEKDIALTLHFDTKQLEQRMIVEKELEVEEPQVRQGRRGRRDRDRRGGPLGDQEDEQVQHGGQGEGERQGYGQPEREEQVGRLVRSCKDRLAVVVTGQELQGDHLLCIPGLEGGTAAEQVDALYAALVQLNLDPYVASVVYDTTATNTGRQAGVVRLIQEKLGDCALLCCPCRR